MNITCGSRVRTTVFAAVALAVLSPGLLGHAPRAVAAPTPKPPWYAGLLAAVTARGDLVLVNADTGATVRTLISHELAPDLARPTIGIAWDARAGIVYFDRRGCTVWRHDVRTGRSARLAAGRAPVISPDGTRLAVRGCAAGPSGWLAIVAASSGKRLRVQRLTAMPDEGGIPIGMADVDWRPDGRALVVTVGRDLNEGSAQLLVDLGRPPRDVTDSPVVPSRSPLSGLYAVEYVGGRLVVAGECCGYAQDGRSSIIGVRDSRTGIVTSIVALDPYDTVEMTAAVDGRMRYLRRRNVGSARQVSLWELDRLDGQPRRVGGNFHAIDW